MADSGQYKSSKKNVGNKMSKIDKLKGIALKLLEQGRSVAQIAYLTDLPIDEINSLKCKMVDNND